jgi:hypothetical protein
MTITGGWRRVVNGTLIAKALLAGETDPSMQTRLHFRGRQNHRVTLNDRNVPVMISGA